jgi:hypothetical protein
MVTQNEVTKLKNWFEEYVKIFKSNDREIQRNYDLKVIHTKNVCKNIIEIGKDLGLENTDIYISEIIALFHDLGRFEQFFKYKTFSDEKSENHSKLAIKIINKYSVLEKLDEFSKEIIKKSILNHNKISIEDEKDEKVLFFSKLIRDADKLDIFRLIIEYYKNKENEKNDTIELGLRDTDDYSEDIYNKVINQQVARYEDLKLSNDFKILQLSWIYDINFSYSFKKIKEKDYLTSIYNALPKSEKITTLYNKIISYLNQKCINMIKN